MDTGATYSTFSEEMDLPLSTEVVPVQGIGGQTIYLSKTQPVTVTVGNQCLFHSFLLSPQCAINLLGRDLLQALHAQILLHPEGTMVTFSNGETHLCTDMSVLPSAAMRLSHPRPGDLLVSDIYWGLVIDQDHNQLLSAFANWFPHVKTRYLLFPPPDPMHVILFYDRDCDLTYQVWFNDTLEGQEWTISSPGIVVGPEGAAAPVCLTPDQMTHYKMAPESAPHVTLAIATGGQAKALGPMIAATNKISDWQETSIKDVYISVEHPQYTFYKAPTTVKVILNHQQLQRHHGAENTNDSEAEAALSALPSSMWVSHQADVGLLKVKPIEFQVDTAVPVNLPQYPIKPGALQGIQDTIEGLLKARVIYHTTSPWNTPILPVLKADGKTYRMAHDLRAINNLVLEPSQAVPNPATALSLLTPNHQWFTVIDLANAFFCLPLHKSLQPIFAFTFAGQQYTYPYATGVFLNTWHL